LLQNICRKFIISCLSQTFSVIDLIKFSRKE